MFRPDSVVLHTLAFRGEAGIEEVKNWHTWPRFDPGRNQFRYKGQWFDDEQDLPAAVQGKSGNGWLDVGYHYIIRKNGAVEPGRDEITPGAHCAAGGMNRKSLGIAFEGHGDFEPLTSDQFSAFVNLMDGIRDRHPIHSETVYGHNEFDSFKTCPGKEINMGTLRKTLQARWND